MKVDAFVPSLSLALEYQGQHHYHTNLIIGDISKRQHREEEKKNACKEFGVTLIQVPYWIKDKTSLQKLIYQQRPDI
jgi:hypothetical protein